MTTSRHETLVGLHVADQDGYTRYRAAMTPLLEAVGGYFRYDFTVDQQLRGDNDPPINRVFVISFPDAETESEFFADPAYVAAKKEFFEPSVAATNILGTLAPAQR